MPRSLSNVAKAAIFGGQTSEVFVVLLELEHPSFVQNLRFCSNDLTVSAFGYDYLPFPFEIVLPNDADDEPPRVTLRIDNVDRRIVGEIRNITGGGPVMVRVYVVLASQPDTIEVGPLEFSLRDVEYNDATIEGSLMYEEVLNEQFPADAFTPARFPGLF